MEKKKNIGLYCDAQTLDEIDATLEQADCRTRNEFIRKAIRFYLAYWQTQGNSAVLLPAIDDLLGAKMRDTESRLSRVLYKMGVELAMMMNVVAAGFKVNDDSLDDLREMCEERVSQLNGRYRFDDAVKFQR